MWGLWATKLKDRASEAAETIRSSIQSIQSDQYSQRHSKQRPTGIGESGRKGQFPIYLFIGRGYYQSPIYVLNLYPRVSPGLHHRGAKNGRPQSHRLQ
jgi:hypothetical protein